SGANDFGANCFWLENTDNELSYNRGENCVAPSFDYGRDGGFVELFGVTDRSHIHHNYAKNTDGFSEISGPGDASAYNIRMHHNVIVDVFTPVLCVHTDNPLAKIEDVRFENNTVYKLTGGGNPTIDCLKREGSPTTLLLRNNIFVSDVAIARTGAITHTNNLYSLVSGVNPGFALDSTEKLSDAGFFAAEKGDLRLAEGSAAVDAGLALGYAADYTGRAASGLPDLGAYELGSAITVFAAGEAADGVYPTMRLLVDDVPVATWTDIKGSPALRQFQTFTYNHPKTVAIDSIKVEFVNDSGTGGARNLIVDKVSLDGKNHHTEAETSYSTSCQSGYQKTEWLYCNGTVAYKSE
ncbi:MAG TPA: carbohydrate-binding domain-containing protein, partial [Oligoflexus sp.]|uniref:carbohydrate-binding domain-containing protein n=1 Tax=Oligoflexus sp. TaxID=1971216 RepID=UPI002D49C31E